MEHYTVSLPNVSAVYLLTPFNNFKIKKTIFKLEDLSYVLPFKTLVKKLHVDVFLVTKKLIESCILLCLLLQQGM